MAFSIKYVYQAVDRFTGTARKISAAAERIGNKMQAAGRKIDGVSQRLSSFGKRAREVGGEMSQKLSLPLAATGGLALRTAFQFQKAMNATQAASNSTGEEMDALTSKVKELGRTTQFSAEQAANAAKFLGQAGLDANEIIKVLPTTLDLAAASGADLGFTADKLTDILAGFGAPMKRAGEFADTLAKTSTMATTDVQQLAQAMSFVSGEAKGMNISFQEVSGAIATIQTQGIKGGRAGRNLAAFISDVTKKSKELQPILGDTSIKVDGLMAVVRKMSEAGLDASNAQEILTRQSARAFVRLASGTETVEKITTATQKADGAAKEMSDIRMQGLVGSFKRLRAAIDGVFLALTDNKAEEAIQLVTGALTDFSRKIADLSEPTQNLIGLLTVLLVVVGPLVAIVGFLAQGIVFLGSALAVVGGVIAGTVLGPILLIVGAIAAAAAVSEDFRKVLFKIGSYILSILGGALSNLIGYFKTLVDIVALALNGIVALIEGGFKVMADHIQFVFDLLTSGFTDKTFIGVLQDQADQLLGSLSDIWDFASGMGGWVAEQLGFGGDSPVNEEKIRKLQAAQANATIAPPVGPAGPGGGMATGMGQLAQLAQQRAKIELTIDDKNNNVKELQTRRENGVDLNVGKNMEGAK